MKTYDGVNFYKSAGIICKNQYNTFYIDACTNIKNWETMSKSELANKYCDAEEDGNIYLRDNYFSALVCKYWYMVSLLRNSSMTLNLEDDEFVFWVIEALLKGLKYRRWRDSNFTVSQVENGPEKVFNQCFTSIRQYYFKYYGQKKRKGNATAISLDSLREENGDSFDKAMLCNCSSAETEYITRENEQSIIDYLMKSNKVLNALLIDLILTRDDVYYIGSYSVNRKKLSDALMSVDVEKFISKYHVNEESTRKTVLKVRSMKTRSVQEVVRKAMTELKNDSVIRGILCC